MLKNLFIKIAILECFSFITFQINSVTIDSMESVASIVTNFRNDVSNREYFQDSIYGDEQILEPLTLEPHSETYQEDFWKNLFTFQLKPQDYTESSQSIKPQSKIPTKQKIAATNQYLKKELLKLKENNTKMYIYNQSLDAIETFSITHLHDSELNSYIANTFYIFKILKYARHGKKVGVSDVLNTIFSCELLEKDSFLPIPVIINNEKAYFSEKALNKKITSIMKEIFS